MPFRSRCAPHAACTLATPMLALALCALAACGGGGSAQPSATTSSTAPLAALAYQAKQSRIDFDAGESRASGGSLSTVTWDFGDGSSAQGLRASHDYALPGEYTATLTVTDSVGVSTSAQQRVSVGPVARSGFDGGATDPFSVCSVKNPNYVAPVLLSDEGLTRTAANGAAAIKVFWDQQNFLANDRLTKGAELCAPVVTHKEAWVGFMFYLPSVGYPADKEAAMFQIFQADPTAVCNSWAGMLVVSNNSLLMRRRASCVSPVSATLMPSIPRDRWVPVVVHMVASGAGNGQVQVWLDGAPKDSPTYTATGINFGRGVWDANDRLTPGYDISFKFGQYDYDDPNYTAGETRTSYYDNIHVIGNGRSDGWEAVHPLGSSFASSDAALHASSQRNLTRLASMAIDGNPTTTWEAAGGSGWLQRNQPEGEPATVSRYTLVTDGVFPLRDPRDWTLLGSNDGVSWTPLDARNNESFSASARSKSYDIATPQPYLQHRLHIRSNRGDSLTSLAEWRLD